MSAQVVDRLKTLSPERRLLLEMLRKEREAPTPVGPFSLISETERRLLPADVEDAYPLSMVQQGMLYHMEMTPDAATPAYHNVNSWHLKTPFDLKLLRRAIARVVARHPILRTSFDLTSFEEPMQLVHRHATMPLRVFDLRQLSWDRQQLLFDEFIARENRRLIPLSSYPMMRLYIHRRTDDSFQFTVSEPHSISDGWSTTSNLAEIFTIYHASLNGVPAPGEPPPAATYRDFVRAEREALASPEARRFWNEKLAGFTATRLPRWPLALKRESRRKPFITVEKETLAGLYRLAREVGVPLKTVALAVHLKVMSVISGQRDLVTGLVANGRPESEDGDQVRGLFLNTIPFRARVEGGSWKDLVRSTFAGETELLPFRRYPVPAMQRQWGREPLFESAFTFLHFHSLAKPILSGGFEYLGGHSDLSVTHYPISGFFRLNPVNRTHLTLFIEYDDGEFPPEQIAAIHRIYEEVMRRMAADPEARHDAANPLPEDDLRYLIAECNAVAPVDCERTLPESFARQTMRTPSATALIDGETELTYRELDGLSNRLAHRLREQGIGLEDRVGVCLERGADLVVALLAVLKAGGAYVPLDPAYPRERLGYMLLDSAARTVVTSSRLAALMGASGLSLVLYDGEAPSDEAGTGPSNEAFTSGREDGPLPGNLAYLIYTSGSTGRPKGVAIEHRGAATLLDWALSTYLREDLAGVLAATSVCFDLSIFELFVPLTSGGTVILAKNALALPDLAASDRVTLINTVPSAMAELLEEGALPAGLRVVNLAGEPLPARLVRQLHERGVTRVWNLYGPSEDSTYSTGAEIAAGSERPEIGRPLSGRRALVLDGFGQPAPLWVPGELFLGGSGLARGYLGAADATAERFVPDPFSAAPGARLYRTGDLVRRRLDGALDYLGRFDHQVKVRGFRIELGEIEKVLRDHPAVRDGVVVARDEGDGHRRLVAYLVPQSAGDSTSGSDFDPGSNASGLDVGLLRAQLGMKLPAYMVPAVFVTLDALPMTPNGKIDRAALPAPQTAAQGSAGTYVAPRSELETRIAEVWAELLGLSRVSVVDNFFDLGGDSLLLLRTQRRLRQRLGIDLAVTDLFRFPTVAALAERASGADGNGAQQEPGHRAEARRDAAARQGRSVAARRALRREPLG